MQYSIIGLGKLGASMAAAISSRGFNVIGVDVSKTSVDRVNNGNAPIYETDLQETISQNQERISATLDHTEAVLNSDITFVVVPTPSEESGAFATKYAEEAFSDLGRGIREKEGYHLLVLSSTVLPGSCRTRIIPLIEKVSGKKCGVDFGFCYSPEFIALGSIIKDFLNPDFTLVGEYDERSGALLESAYAEFMANSPACQRMSIENAELTKVALNAFLTTKITYANMITEICEKLPGGDVDVVSRAIGKDTRIGGKYLKGGVGFGGPCFPRDNVALTYIMEQLGINADLPKTVHQLNTSIPNRLAEIVSKVSSGDSEIAILGLSYKPGSHITQDSQSIMLIEKLLQADASIKVFDPLVTNDELGSIGDEVTICTSVESCIENTSTIVVMTDDPAFKSLGANIQATGNSNITVIDCWRDHSEAFHHMEQVNYIPLGFSMGDDQNEERLKEIWDAKSKKLSHSVIIETNTSASTIAERNEFFKLLNARSIEQDRALYEAGSPFPHIVLDSILPETLVHKAMELYPRPNDPVWSNHGTLYEVEGVAKKFCLTKSEQFPLPLKVIVDFLNGPEFISYVEQITGLDNLIPDPDLFGGGLNMVDQGGMLEVHADYNFNNDLNAYRCVNALVYFNDDWKEEYGGALELWDMDKSSLEKVVLPQPGRVLVFATNDETFHGYGPVKEPNGRTRNSINIYYHREQPAPRMSAKPHRTIWKDVGRAK